MPRNREFRALASVLVLAAAAPAALAATSAAAAQPRKPAPHATVRTAEPGASRLEAAAAGLRDRALKDNIALEWTRELTTRFGPRPAGSANEQAAAAWAAARLKALGFENVQVQPFPVTGWRRGAEHAEIVTADGVVQPLVAVALGESPPTPADGIEAPVVMFPTLEALAAAPDGSLAGKVAMVDQKMERVRSGAGYGPIARIRATGPGIAAGKGAIAFLLREAGTDYHRMGHTGTTRYVAGRVAIPAFAVTHPDADQIDRLLALGGPVRVRLQSGASYVTGTHSQNVIAEIRGRERPDEVVLLGAHLDSWDLGTGAIDDGTGTAIISAAARLIAELPQRPRRTIRVVLFGSEEVAQPDGPGGAFGGHAYLDARRGEVARHVAAGESDFGADRIYALNLPKGAQTSSFAVQAARVLRPIGVAVTDRPAGEGGTDIGPIVEAGAPVFELNQDGTRYFDLHHTADDTFDKIDPAQLNQNVAAWAAMIWLIADSDVEFRTMTPGK